MVLKLVALLVNTEMLELFSCKRWKACLEYLRLNLEQMGMSWYMALKFYYYHEDVVTLQCGHLYSEQVLKNW